MALISTSQSSSLFFSTTHTSPRSPLSTSKSPSTLAFTNKTLKPFLLRNPSTKNPTSPSPLLTRSSLSDTTPDSDSEPNPAQINITDERGEKAEPAPEPDYPSPLLTRSSLSDTTPDSDSEPNPAQINITDEWGEKAEPTPEPDYPKAPDADPPTNEDEWEEEYVGGGNGTPAAVESAGLEVEVEVKDGRLEELKRALVDTVYGMEFGFRASPEVRAEVSELVNQLEALNPTPAPVEATGLLDGNWILVYTAFSELLPLLALGATPLLKVKSISQAIDTGNLSIVNQTTLSSPFATLSFSASATFEVRSPSRIQVEFKEGTLQPPEIKRNVDLPESVDIFGQKISLSPIQQSLNPLQEAVATISRTISGQPPLKLPIPGRNRSSSWLLVTYLDEDFRISRGDGGLFILAREGSPLLNL